MEKTLNDFIQALLSLDRVAARRIVAESTRDVSPMTFVEDIVVAALERIGAGWEEGTFALSQVYMAGRICEDLVDEILPPGAPERKDQPRMAICVLMDHHKLGKMIVHSLLRAGGFEVIDYDVMEVDELVERVGRDRIEILLISVLMLPSALKVRSVKEKLAGSSPGVKIVVGGAPFRFDDRLWRNVGADAVCKTASDVVPVVSSILGGAA